MIASKVAGEYLLPYVISGIGARIAGSSIEEGMITRNPHQMGDFSNGRASASLQPTGGYTPDDPRRQSNIDAMMEQRERNMRIREETKRQQEASLNPTIQEQYQGYGMSPFSQQPREIVAQPVIQPLDTLPQQNVQPNGPAPLPQINNERSAFDDEDEIDLDEMHQHLIDNVMNGHHDDSLPLDNDSVDSVEEQRAMNDLRPTTQQYPGGGNGAPSVGDIIKKGNEIAQVVGILAPKKKPEEKKKEEKKREEVKESPIEQSKDEKRKSMKSGKVDIHDIFAKTLVNRPTVNTRRLL